MTVVEDLTLPVALTTVLPLCAGKNRPSEIFYVDASPLGRSVATFMAGLFKTAITPLDFSFFDIRDDKGSLIRLRIPYEDVVVLRAKILADPLFKAVLKEPSVAEGGMGHYFAKSFLRFHFVHDTDSILRAMALAQIVVWKNKHAAQRTSKPIVLYIRPRHWMPYVAAYAQEYGVSLKLTVSKILSLPDVIVNALGRYKLRYVWCAWQRRGKQHVPLPSAGVKINLDYSGHLNLDDARMHSDVFFATQGGIDGKDVLVNFRINRDPLDEKKWQQLHKHGINAVALTPPAAAYAEAPFFNHAPQPDHAHLPDSIFPSGRDQSPEARWFKKEYRLYNEKRQYWQDYFKQTNTKIFTTWFKYDAEHMVTADALRREGGIFTVYQRAFEETVRPETCVWTDVLFGFSKMGVALEQASLSVIPYYVVTGYGGDYRFKSLKPTADDVRLGLQKHGAERIMAYFDENSNDNARWHTGHKPMRENYAFLLEKVLQDPKLGLVIKPKTPVTLRRRLGAVNDLLKQAEATGRCFIFETGRIQGSYPPATAALAADFAIHGHLDSATAGLESALAGVPTLLMDREGWPQSKLHRMGPHIAFTNWPDLWRTVEEHWKSPKGLEGFGQWGAALHEFDPFRDGRGAERMGTYLRWLLEGYKQGMKRDAILEHVADRYAQAWGKDKIYRINT